MRLYVRWQGCADGQYGLAKSFLVRDVLVAKLCTNLQDLHWTGTLPSIAVTRAKSPA